MRRSRKPQITMTPPLLNRGPEVRLLVTSVDKAGVLREPLEGPRTPGRLPVPRGAPGVARLAWPVELGAAAELSTDRSA